jgi:uncharacterized RDD family membrane protein YckC
VTADRTSFVDEPRAAEHAPAKPVAASLLRRLAALVYDALLLTGIIFVFTLLVVLVRGAHVVAPQTWWFEGCLVAIAMLFYVGFWTHGGQTLGMRAWRIRVIGRDGGPVSAARATVRFLTAWLAALPAGLGYWWSLWDPQALCWHDRLSRTRVIRVDTLADTQQRNHRNQQ